MKLANKPHQWILLLLLGLVQIACTAAARGQASLYGYNGNDVTGIDSVRSEITLSGAPSNAGVTFVDVHFEVHADYEFGVFLHNGEESFYMPKGQVYSPIPPHTHDVEDIVAFWGNNPNQTWYLTVEDRSSYYPGVDNLLEITEWWIRVYYSYPEISVSPVAHDFGVAALGGPIEPREITIANTKGFYLHISDVILSDTTNFTLDVNGGSNPLGSTSPIIPGGESRTVAVIFNPMSVGRFDAGLSISSDDLNNPNVTVSLTGWARHAQTFFVDSDATGANDGSSWTSAFNHLQDALRAAISGDAIRVAKGTYTPDANAANPDGTGDRTATFHLKNGVAIKGSYAGFGHPDPNIRSMTLYETILSGDLSDNDVAVANPSYLLTEATRAENSYHVVMGSGTDETSTLDGFTITAGNANRYVQDNGYGGGMFINTGSPTVVNCVFTQNSGAYSGGGMHNHSNARTVVTDCTFAGNYSDTGGGGIGNSGDSSPIVTGCDFTGNAAGESGGGVCNGSDSYSTISNCTFCDNSALESGGAIALFPSSGGTISNCTFYDNSAPSGGAIYTHDGSPRVNSCKFIGNSADMGAGMANLKDSNPIVTNCMFCGNVADEGGAISNTGADVMLSMCTFVGNSSGSGNALSCDSAQQAYPSDLDAVNCILWDGGSEIWNNDGSTITITYSDIQSGWPGQGNIDTDPSFVNAGYWDPNGTPLDPNDDFWVDGNYRLMAGSPCIDAGDNSAVPPDVNDLDGDGNTTEPLPFDLAGRPRFFDDPNTTDTGNGTPPIVDIGAYEFRGTDLIIGDFCGPNFGPADRYVDVWDLMLFADHWHTRAGEANWDAEFDLAGSNFGDADGYVDVWDLMTFADHWHQGVQP